MTIIDMLERNAREFAADTALVEINPGQAETRRLTWRDYDLVESEKKYFRREISWSVFDEKANRFANALIARGIKKGDKVAILLMNCIEWLPIYFGILKTGALAVPLNFRYSS
ncbi:MAG: acyl--CoA ligase, partial [Ruminococcus sp.]|nr:acyl--CoA ligase [Ruminococcus sp.]